MATVNETLSDVFTTHAVTLARVEAGTKQRILRLLRALEKQLLAEVAQVDPTGVVRTAFQQRRLETLLASVQETIRAAYRNVRTATRVEVQEIAELEHRFAAQALNQSVGIDLVSPVINRQVITTLVSETLLDGAPLGELWNRQSQIVQQRFLDAMRDGILRGEPLERLLQRVRGTRAQGFRDGVMRASRTSATRLVRTAVQTIANRAREAFYEEHQDLIKGLVWRATLDARTTLICAVRDGRLYSLAKEPIGHRFPWQAGPGSIHPQCRSTSIPVTKSWAELSGPQAVRTGGRPTSIQRAFEQRLRARGFSEADIATRIANARASMDGLVPRTTSFPTWLRQKDAASPGFGARVLGPTRWNLWRSGQLSFTDLVNFDGEPLRVQDVLARMT